MTAGAPEEDPVADWQRRLAGVLEEAAAIPVDTRGATPFEVASSYRGDRVQLRRYAPSQGALQRSPVLIVYSLINRPFILDLTPQRSLIGALCRAGHPVYLIDWGYARGADRFLTLTDYIEGLLGAAADDVAAAEGARPDLLGVCQGGILALALAALHPQRAARLVTLVTPVDCRTPEDNLARMAADVDFDRMAETFGNIPAELLNAAFVALKPYRLLSERYVDLPELAGRPEALRDFLHLERWMYDSPDQAGRALAAFARELYQRNALLRGELTLGGGTVRLDAIRHPVLNVYAEQDHLVPPAAARALGPAVGSADYRELTFPGGHLGTFISRRAHRELIPEVLGWLAD